MSILGRVPEPGAPADVVKAIHRTGRAGVWGSPRPKGASAPLRLPFVEGQVSCYQIFRFSFLYIFLM